IATVTVIIPAVGTVVSISLIAAAPTVLKGRVASTPRFVALSTLASTIIAVVGLGLAVVCGLSAGGTIALVAGGFFVIVEAGSRIASSKLASAI
ncbi:MAG: metal ABC transporter permease, partial [Actinomyces sp.]|nr:metal ABC transporter permease [Actinomyces sp.]